MDFLIFFVLLALVFGACYAIDKGFSHFFRNQAQHHSGMAVRLNKKYGAFGVLLIVLGVAALMASLKGDKVLLIGGIVVVLLGIWLVIYYMTCAIFYDEDAFIFNSLSKKKKTYAYRQIRAQQLYNASGNIVVELHMEDGSVVAVQSAMSGAYDFLNYAFAAWCRQKGVTQEDCPFYDPANSCWFPPVEAE